MGKIGTKFITIIITLYRYLISPFLGNCCRFYPSCSRYAIDALESQGIFRGCILTLKRISRCHPWHPGGFDPIPEKTHYVRTN